MITIKIRNMVCKRCILTVKEVVDRLGIEYNAIALGSLEVPYLLDEEQLRKLGYELEKAGFQILTGQKRLLIEGINQAIHLYIELSKDPKRSNLSEFLRAQFKYDYPYLSTLYSAAVGKTIEQYFKEQRIQKVKELLLDTTLTLKEIASYTGYASIYFLSNQFKQQTGMSPSRFKKLQDSSLEQHL